VFVVNKKNIETLKIKDTRRLSLRGGFFDEAISSFKRKWLMNREYYVYILTNKYNKVLYIGVTNDLIRRVYEHKEKMTDGFTSRYNINKLVYYETTGDIRVAIEREKQLKGGSRKDKKELIENNNSKWEDLYNKIV